MSTQTQSLLQSRENINFLVFDWLKAGNLLSRERYTDHTDNDMRIMLDVAARIAETKFATRNQRNDREGPFFNGESVVLHDDPATGWHLSPVREQDVDRRCRS